MSPSQPPDYVYLYIGTALPNIILIKETVLNNGAVHPKPVLGEQRLDSIEYRLRKQDVRMSRNTQSEREYGWVAWREMK
ncbi:MAG: hypothetical protein NTY41_03165 [Proteobacteria bacterium]|nr:hypothetical protein [Pseudomonadota bacterium]